MNFDLARTAEYLLGAIPLIATILSVIVGARQVRSLRDLTGDRSFVSKLFGLSFGPPHVADPDTMTGHRPLRVSSFLRRHLER